jgi:tRNA pseudouridine13 synthase
MPHCSDVMENFEQSIGIGTYYTKTPGVGGKLRTFPEDFVVKELCRYPPKNISGRYTIAEVFSKNWETHTLIKELANRLHVSRKRISFAGTKDKRACTTQLMSFAHISKSALEHLSIKDVGLDNIYPSDIPVRIGDLLGNRFEIIIRRLHENNVVHSVEEMVAELETLGGFPNFFGVQRFGVIRPITHLVGRALVQGSLEDAVLLYIGHPMQGESELVFQLRQQLDETRDFAKALHEYPEELNFERAILNKLVVDPNDFIGAFQELPKNLQTMFINAYQSYLFNKILSERIRRNLPINKAVVGDVVLPVRKGLITSEPIPVTSANIDKVNHQVLKQKAYVSGILVGSNTCFAQGEMGEIEHRIVDEEGIDYRDFIIPDIPYLSSSGTRRALLAPLQILKWKIQSDKESENNKLLWLKFDLLKGCYATSVLRELMKSQDIQNY